jgi:hypothetical protein
MGRQVNFFFLPQDLNECEGRIRQLGPVVFFESRSQSAAPELLENTVINEMGKTWLDIYLALPEHLPLVKLREVKAQGWYSVEESTSPVIELSRCYFDGKILRRGRLYYNESYYAEDGQLITKPNDFTNWARKVLKVAVKGLLKDPNTSSYVGRGASLWREQEKGSFVL